jgi:hypothetical protein
MDLRELESEQVESSCESGNELAGSIKLLGNYRVATQLVASRIVLSSEELVIYMHKHTDTDMCMRTVHKVMSLSFRQLM